MNTQDTAESIAADNIVEAIKGLAEACVARYALPADQDAAAGALCAVVAEKLLGGDYVIVPRYVLAELRKQLEDVQ